MPPSTTSSFSILRVLRKWGPALFFVLLGGLMLFGHDLLLAITTAIHGADVAAVGPNAEDAVIVADQQAGGWVQVGAVTSKLVTAGGAFIWAAILVWRMQRLVLPRPAQWARAEYSGEFDQLSRLEKFQVYQSGRWQLIALAAAALIFAAVVQ